MLSIYIATPNGWGEIVELLLRHGVDAESVCSSVGDVKALHTAAGGGWTEIVTKLVEHGVDLEPRKSMEGMPLALASQIAIGICPLDEYNPSGPA